MLLSNLFITCNLFIAFRFICSILIVLIEFDSFAAVSLSHETAESENFGIKKGSGLIDQAGTKVAVNNNVLAETQSKVNALDEAETLSEDQIALAVSI